MHTKNVDLTVIKETQLKDDVTDLITLQSSDFNKERLSLLLSTRKKLKGWWTRPGFQQQTTKCITNAGWWTEDFSVCKVESKCQSYHLNTDRSIQTSKLSRPRLPGGIYWVDSRTAGKWHQPSHNGWLQFSCQQPNWQWCSQLHGYHDCSWSGSTCKWSYPALQQSLDLIFTEYISDIRVHRCNLSTFTPDLCFTECSTSIQKAEIAQVNIIYRPIKDTDYKRMSDETSINRDLNFNDMVKDFRENLIKALDIHAVIITKTITDWFRVSWLTLEVKLIKQRLRRRMKVWRHFKTDDHWAAYKVVWAEYRSAIRRAECDIISKNVLDCGLDTQNLMH